MKEKKCSKCKKVKPVSEFWIKRSSASGYNSSCIKCNIKIVKNKNCKVCNKSFKPYTTLDKFCSAQCRIDNEKSKRTRNWKQSNYKKIMGKNNPAYRNGNYCRSVKKTAVGERKFQKHSKEIKSDMINNKGYIYCQYCNTSNSLKFETHHIVFRSEKPLHKHLHDKDNLMILCIQCHNDFHKDKGKRNEIVIDRKLNDMFGNDILNKN